jgi:hypothetical protein
MKSFMKSRSQTAGRHMPMKRVALALVRLLTKLARKNELLEGELTQSYHKPIYAKK